MHSWLTSIEAMRESIKRASSNLPGIREVPRVGALNAASLRARAAEGLSFLIPGLVTRWPPLSLTPHTLRERYSHLPVRASGRLHQYRIFPGPRHAG